MERATALRTYREIANDRPVINGQIVARNAFDNDKFSNMDLRVTKSVFFT